MIRTYGFIVFVFIMGHIMNVAIEGRAFASSTLSANITAVATSVPVTDVSQFHPAGDLIYVDDEVMRYTAVDVGGSLLTGVTRAVGDTDAEAHSSGAIIRGSEAGALERMLAFNVSQSDSVIGRLTMPFQVSWAFISAIPKFLTWDYPALNNGAGVYYKFPLYAISAMVVVGIVSMLVGALSGIFTR